MTLLFVDGFDAQDTARKWSIITNGTGTISWTNSTRLGSGYAAQFSRSSTGVVYGIQRNFTAASHIFLGAAIQHGRIPGQPYSPAFHVLLGDGGTTAHLYLVVNSVGALQLWRGDGRLAAVPGGAYAPNGTMIASSAAGLVDTNWHYIEIGATIDPAAGTATVQFDGTTAITFTGNTKNGGTNSSIDAVCYQGLNGNYFGSYTDLGSPIVDDLYIANSSGSVNNSFLGDVRIQTLMPNADGTFTQWTPTGSSSHYQNVDEVPDNTATFNASSTSGQTDTYALTNTLPGTGTIFGVQQVTTAAKSDSGSASLIPVLLMPDSTMCYGATRLLGTSWTTYEDLYEKNPDGTVAWTTTVLDGMQAGVQSA